eukprot:1707453-Amphidinium_carterae.1
MRIDEATTSRSALSIQWKELLQGKKNLVSSPADGEATEASIAPEDSQRDTQGQGGMQKVDDGASCGSSLAGDDVSTTADSLSQPESDSFATTLTDHLLTTRVEAVPPRAKTPLA